jgi:hypothetical protein
MMNRFVTGRVVQAGGLAMAVLGVCVPPAAARQAAPSPATPAEMVATYETLADGILALKKTEENLCRSILAASYAHGQVELARARKAIAAADAKAAQSALEALAAAVGHMGTEGDNAVAGVRKRLIDGGHHHNAAGEAQGIFDAGFVIVTRAAKQKLLESSRAIGQLSRTPKADALDAEWKKVTAVYEELLKPSR